MSFPIIIIPLILIVWVIVNYMVASKAGFITRETILRDMDKNNPIFTDFIDV